MPDLSNATVEQLLQALGAKTPHGVASVRDPERGRVEVWWGDRTKVLGYTSRLAHEIHREMDDLEDSEDESEPEEDAEEALDDLAKEFPQLGLYL